MGKRTKTLWEDLISQPISNGFKIGGLILGIAYLWLFSQLAPTLRDVAVIQNDISNMKSDIAEVKDGIKDLNDHLLGSAKGDTKQASIIPTERIIEKLVTPVPVPNPAPEPKKQNGNEEKPEENKGTIREELDSMREILSDVLGIVNASN